MHGFFCFADIIWPALFLEFRLLNPVVVAIGLVAEFFVLCWPLGLPWRKALLANLLMNLATSLIGIMMIPGFGFFWELGPGQLVNYLFNVGTFNPLSWGVTWAFAVLLNVWSEWLLLWILFRVPGTPRVLLWLGAANAVSVSIALISLFLVPLQR